MDITVSPRRLCGNVPAIPSKSAAHRLLICAAFADWETVLHCKDTNRDIEATAECLRALGATVTRSDAGYTVIPADHIPDRATLPCGESGSTLRFLLPVAGALGVDATFLLSGRLPQRPLSPLWEEMERMGCRLSRPETNTVRCTGRLQPGAYVISGGVSSQYISGLLFAHRLMDGESTLTVTGTLESEPYVAMTKQALSLFGESGPLCSPGEIRVEGDWSNAAFFLAAQAMGSDVRVTGLSDTSLQGDRAVASLLPLLKSGRATVCARDIPDLVPILSVVAATNHGAVFTDIRRLRLKETDRVATVCAMLEALGGRTEATENTLTVFPATLTGGTVDATGDHRIAMAAAIAATAAQGPVTVVGADSVNKSYPSFWAEYRRIGGNYELNLR